MDFIPPGRCTSIHMVAVPLKKYWITETAIKFTGNDEWCFPPNVLSPDRLKPFGFTAHQWEKAECEMNNQTPIGSNVPIRFPVNWSRGWSNPRMMREISYLTVLQNNSVGLMMEPHTYPKRLETFYDVVDFYHVITNGIIQVFDEMLTEAQVKNLLMDFDSPQQVFELIVNAVTRKVTMKVLKMLDPETIKEIDTITDTGNLDEIVDLVESKGWNNKLSERHTNTLMDIGHWATKKFPDAKDKKNPRTISQRPNPRTAKLRLAWKQLASCADMSTTDCIRQNKIFQIIKVASAQKVNLVLFHPESAVERFHWVKRDRSKDTPVKNPELSPDASDDEEINYKLVRHPDKTRQTFNCHQPPVLDKHDASFRERRFSLPLPVRKPEIILTHSLSSPDLRPREDSAPGDIEDLPTKNDEKSDTHTFGSLDIREKSAPIKIQVNSSKYSTKKKRITLSCNDSAFQNLENNLPEDTTEKLWENTQFKKKNFTTDPVKYLLRATLTSLDSNNTGDNWQEQNDQANLLEDGKNTAIIARLLSEETCIHYDKVRCLKPPLTNGVGFCRTHYGEQNSCPENCLIGCCCEWGIDRKPENLETAKLVLKFGRFTLICQVTDGMINRASPKFNIAKDDIVHYRKQFQKSSMIVRKLAEYYVDNRNVWQEKIISKQLNSTLPYGFLTWEAVAIRMANKLTELGHNHLLVGDWKTQFVKIPQTIVDRQGYMEPKYSKMEDFPDYLWPNYVEAPDKMFPALDMEICGDAVFNCDQWDDMVPITGTALNNIPLLFAAPTPLTNSESLILILNYETSHANNHLARKVRDEEQVRHSDYYNAAYQTGVLAYEGYQFKPIGIFDASNSSAPKLMDWAEISNFPEVKRILEALPDSVFSGQDNQKLERSLENAIHHWLIKVNIRQYRPDQFKRTQKVTRYSQAISAEKIEQIRKNNAVNWEIRALSYLMEKLKSMGINTAFLSSSRKSVGVFVQKLMLGRLRVPSDSIDNVVNDEAMDKVYKTLKLPIIFLSPNQEMDKRLQKEVRTQSYVNEQFRINYKNPTDGIHPERERRLRCHQTDMALTGTITIISSNETAPLVEYLVMMPGHIDARMTLLRAALAKVQSLYEKKADELKNPHFSNKMDFKHHEFLGIGKAECASQSTPKRLEPLEMKFATRNSDQIRTINGYKNAKSIKAIFTDQQTIPAVSSFEQWAGLLAEVYEEFSNGNYEIGTARPDIFRMMGFGPLCNLIEPRTEQRLRAMANKERLENDWPRDGYNKPRGDMDIPMTIDHKDHLIEKCGHLTYTRCMRKMPATVIRDPHVKQQIERHFATRMSTDKVGLIHTEDDQRVNQMAQNRHKRLLPKTVNAEREHKDVAERVEKTRRFEFAHTSKRATIKPTQVQAANSRQVQQSMLERIKVDWLVDISPHRFWDDQNKNYIIL